jgi:hypothetical protein
MEVVPHDFDAKKKYPVLFHVYGGPGSQLVSHKFELSWQTFVASQLGFIVVTVSISLFKICSNGINNIFRLMAEELVSKEESLE